MPEIAESLIDRLVCAKYIFESGADVLDRAAPYAAGIAVLAFQDAAELVLRTIAESVHASIKENTQFSTILDEIDKAAPGKLTHRSALNQLNKARVNFKHLGLAPRDPDVAKFRRDLDGFFATAAHAFLGLDFSTLSLSSLVTHRRTRNWIEKAEAALAADDYSACTAACAVAFHVFQKHRDRADEGRKARDFRFPVASVETAHLAQEVAKQLQDAFGDVRDQLELLGAGISYADFRRFQDLTPRVYFTGNGFVNFQPRGVAVTAAEPALFCLTFTRNLVLKLQGQYVRPNRFAPRGGPRRYVTTAATCIIVEPPRDGGQAEVIESVPAGIELVAYSDSRYDRPGYTAVLHQSECAFVASSDLEAAATS